MPLDWKVTEVLLKILGKSLLMPETTRFLKLWNTMKIALQIVLLYILKR